MEFNMKTHNIIATMIITASFTGSYYLYKETKRINSFEAIKHDIKSQWATDDLLEKINNSYDKIFTPDGFIKEDVKKKYENDVKKNANKNTTNDDLKKYDKSFLEKLLTTGKLTYQDVDKLIEQKKMIMPDNHLATTNILQQLILDLQEDKDVVYDRETETEMKRFQVPMWFVLNTTPSANFYGKDARLKGSPTFNPLKFKNWDLYNQKYKNKTKMANFVNQEWKEEEGGIEKTKIWKDRCKERNIRCLVLKNKIDINSNVFLIVDLKYDILHIFYQNSIKTNLGDQVVPEAFVYFYNKYNLKTKQWHFKDQPLLEKVLNFVDLERLEYTK